MVEIGKNIDLEDLLPEIKKAQEKPKEAGQVFMLNIAGQSAAGKSTISTLISSGLREGLIIDMDDYLKGGFIENLSHESGDPEKPFFAGLNPDVYDLDELFEDLLKLRKGICIEKPVFDEVKKARVGTRLVDPTNTLILDGIYALDPPFRSLADLAILVEASLHDRLMRKLVRNHVYYREDIDGIIKTYLTQDEPAYLYHRDRLLSEADLVVDNPANPQQEYSALLQIRYVTDSTGARNATPKIPHGSLHNAEKFSFDTNDFGEIMLQYSVSSRALIRDPITPDTYDLIQKFYTIANE